MTNDNTQEFFAMVHEGDARSPYYVVLRSSEEIIAWSAHKDRDDFEQWYSQNMLDGSDRPLCQVYEIIAQGVSLDEVSRLVA